ncbi:MAG TPA: metalloregulator ArsR/SmtB family transcription factor [Dongiaceae bacterium]|jgi:DNA-binding transcriptional ArsR family regulator|nr:metalloregulator ArsR/SmtB family transcription factor [Dongiaceae bacterium]
MRAAVNTLLGVLADPTRRALFERLCRDGEQTVRALTARAGVSQPAVSKHLGLLRRCGLVRCRRLGREAHYTARPEGLTPVIDWIDVYAAFWRERLEAS